MRGWKSGCEKINGLGFESSNSSGASTSDLLKLEIRFKIDCVETSESVRGELFEKLGRGEEVRSDSEMREEWR